MVTIKRDDKKVVLTQWGKSMYGGWYINFRVEEQDGQISKYDGFHGRTLAEVCEQAGVTQQRLKAFVNRWDN